jgi:hypothetical protein
MRVRLFVLLLIANSINMAISAPVASAQGVWSYDTSTGFIPRVFFSTDTLGGKLIVVGGDDYNNPLQVFDPALHQWSTPVTEGTFVRAVSTLSGIFDGKLFAIGTYYSGSPFSDTVKEYDPSTLTLSTVVSSGAVAACEAACGAMVNGKLYVIGGDTLDANHPTNILEVFDPSTNTWSRPVTTGEFKAATHGTCSVVDGKIYVFGAGVNVFDPSTNTWTNLVTTGTWGGAADNSTSCAFEGKIYLFGGGGSFSTNTAQVFDPATNVWSSLTPLPDARSMLSSCILNGKIYVLGGYSPHKVYNNVWVFTPGVNDVSSSLVSSSSFDLSPNPTEGIITVHAANIKNVTVENLLGERVLEVANPRASEFTLDLTKLPAGLYFARFEMESGEVVMRKIVKE